MKDVEELAVPFIAVVGIYKEVAKSKAPIFAQLRQALFRGN